MSERYPQFTSQQRADLRMLIERQVPIHQLGTKLAMINIDRGMAEWRAAQPN